MGSVLAQDEVDALLAGVASDEIDIDEDETNTTRRRSFPST